MKRHKCADCKFMHTFLDSSEREIAICVFDLSDNYLQEVGYCTKDCELDDLQKKFGKKNIRRMTMANYINLEAAYDQGTLTDWYISSVGSESPVWTDEHIEELLNDFYVIPKHTPTADVAPVVHGHWIYNPNGMDFGLGSWECSICGAKNDNLPRDRIINPYNYVGSKYCPNCGAKMDEFLTELNGG